MLKRNCCVRCSELRLPPCLQAKVAAMEAAAQTALIIVIVVRRLFLCY